MNRTALYAKDRSMQKADLCGNKENTVWIIRFSDGALRSVHGSYEDAKKTADQLKGSREVIAII